MNTDPAAQRAFFFDAIQHASSWILERTVALFAQAQGGNPVVEGSGVLLQIADARFVLSAAHVVAGIVKDGRTLLLGAHGLPLISLGGVGIHVSEDQDDVDVAFMRLPDVVGEAVARRKSFVRLSEVDVERRPPIAGGYAVVGYPRGLQTGDSETRQLNAEPFQFFTMLHQGQLDRFTVGHSIAVEFTPQWISYENGEHVRPPALLGISGCGIWRVIGANDGTPAMNWDPTKTIRLAGIEHGTVGNAIKGVLAFRAIDAIRQNHRDLVASIDVCRR